MNSLFYIKVKVGKFIANMVSAMVFNRDHRHSLRHSLDPLNPERCVRYLENHYAQVPALAADERMGFDNTIWVCWLQGISQAPQLVQNCIHSIESHKQKNQHVVVLTNDNYVDYLDLPEWIITKWKRGIITNTHFSDILRIHLLAYYGGCWIDATCFQMASIPLQILQSPLFLFRSHGEFSFTYIQSCFMVSKPNNYVMRKWCAAIRAYWKKENMLINYFTLHLMFIALLQQDKKFKEEFEKVAVISDEPAHLFLREMMSSGVYSADLIEKVEVVRLSDGESAVFTNADCQYGYRQSRFKKEWNNQ